MVYGSICRTQRLDSADVSALSPGNGTRHNQFQPVRLANQHIITIECTFKVLFAISSLYRITVVQLDIHIYSYEPRFYYL